MPSPGAWNSSPRRLRPGGRRSRPRSSLSTTVRPTAPQRLSRHGRARMAAMPADFCSSRSQASRSRATARCGDVQRRFAGIYRRRLQARSGLCRRSCSPTCGSDSGPVLRGGRVRLGDPLDLPLTVTAPRAGAGPGTKIRSGTKTSAPSFWAATRRCAAAWPNAWARSTRLWALARPSRPAKTTTISCVPIVLARRSKSCPDMDGGTFSRAAGRPGPKAHDLMRAYMRGSGAVYAKYLCKNPNCALLAGLLGLQERGAGDCNGAPICFYRNWISLLETSCPATCAARPVMLSYVSLRDSVSECPLLSSRPLATRMADLSRQLDVCAPLLQLGSLCCWTTLFTRTSAIC